MKKAAKARVRFNEIYAGPWEDKLFAIRHYKQGWLVDFAPWIHTFDKGGDQAPKLYTIKADAETDMFALASRMSEPVEHFKIVPMLFMDDKTYSDGLDGG